MMPAKLATRKRTTGTATPRRVYTLHIVSDATGNLASHMISAVLTQFPGITFKQVYHTFKDRKEDIEKTMRTLRRRNHMVFHALINPEHKAALHQACSNMKIPHYDLTGSLVQFIADHTGRSPANDLSRLHETNAGYFHRIEAMEFTAQHDDGRRLESLHDADMVVIGLSRVSKSPTSTFLGSMGYKVANVSITRETGFPEELNAVKRKIVAFTLQPKTLHEIRAKRFGGFEKSIGEKGLRDLPYYDMRAVVEEVVYAESEYKKRGYPMIDTTGMTVEETAALVLRKLNIPRKNLAYE